MGMRLDVCSVCRAAVWVLRLGLLVWRISLLLRWPCSRNVLDGVETEECGCQAVLILPPCLASIPLLAYYRNGSAIGRIPLW